MVMEIIISEVEARHTLLIVRKSEDPGNLHPRTLKELTCELEIPSTRIFNESVNSRVYSL